MNATKWLKINDLVVSVRLKPDASARTEEHVGQQRRAIDGTMRSSRVQSMRKGSWEFETTLLTRIEKERLRDELTATPPLSVKGLVFGERIDPTHTRTSVARYLSSGDVLEEAASGVLRDAAYVTAGDGETYRTTLLEGAGAQELSDPTDLTTANWAESTGITTTGGQSSILDGETATLVEDDGSSGLLHVSQIFGTLTGSDETASVILEEKDASFSSIAIYDETASATVVQVEIDWSDGSVAVNEGTGTARVETLTDSGPNGGAVYRVQATGSGTASNSRRILIAPTSRGRIEAAGVYVHIAGHEEQPFASSPMTASARNADSYQQAISFSPRDIVAAEGMTVYSEWVEMGTAFSGNSDRYWNVGSGTSPRLSLISTSTDGLVRAFLQDASGFAIADVSGISFSDHCEAVVAISHDGTNWVLTLIVWANGSQVGTGTATIGTNLPSDWSADSLAIGADGDESDPGHAGHIAHKGASGVRSLSAMRQLSDPDFFHFEDGLSIEPNPTVSAFAELGEVVPVTTGTGVKWRQSFTMQEA